MYQSPCVEKNNIQNKITTTHLELGLNMTQPYMVTRWFRSGASMSELLDGREYELAIEGEDRREMISFRTALGVAGVFFAGTTSCMGSPSTCTLTTSEDQLNSNGWEAPPREVVFPLIISNTFIFVLVQSDAGIGGLCVCPVFNRMPIQTANQCFDSYRTLAAYQHTGCFLEEFSDIKMK